MHLPTADIVARTLRDLFDHAVQVKVAQPLLPPKAREVALYLDADGAVAVLASADLEFAAYSGAALAMIPRAVADDNIRRKKLEENIADNFYEVLNVLASTVNNLQNHHVRLSQIVDATALEPALAARIKLPKPRIDFEASIAGFGVGHVSFIG